MLGSLLFGLKADAGFALARAKRMAIAGAIAGFFLFVAYIAGMIAIAIELAETSGAAAAAGVVCLINVALALFAIAFVLIKNRMERNRRLMTAVSMEAAAQQQGLMMVDGMMRKHPILGVLGIAAVTFLAGRMGM